MLSEKRAKSKTTVEKNLYKLLANSTYGKFVETKLKRMKVKFVTTWNEREVIIQKHRYDMIARITMYFENLIGIKLNTPVKKVVKPFFIGFAFSTCPNTSSTISNTMCSRRHSIMWNYWDMTLIHSSCN